MIDKNMLIDTLNEIIDVLKKQNQNFEAETIYGVVDIINTGQFDIKEDSKDAR